MTFERPQSNYVKPETCHRFGTKAVYTKLTTFPRNKELMAGGAAFRHMWRLVCLPYSDAIYVAYTRLPLSSLVSQGFGREVFSTRPKDLRNGQLVILTHLIVLFYPSEKNIWDIFHCHNII